MSSRYIDISMAIRNGMLVWPTDPPIEIANFKSPTKGDRSTVSKFTMGTHTGTHVDAPSHFIPGAEGIETISPEVLIGRCTVVDVRRQGDVTAAHLAAALQHQAERILLRTGTMEKQLVEGFSKEFPALTAEAAEALVEHGVKLVGIDAMSIEVYHAPGAPTHHTLLAARVAVIENLCLKDVAAGDYDLIALPLLIEGSDGAPARVFLRTLA